MEVKDGLKYTKEHEWAKVEGDVITMGITDYAQHALTDVVFVELPPKDKEVEQFKQLCIVESVKSVSDVFAPGSGQVIEVNDSLSDAPEKVNNDPFGEGWLVKIKLSKPEELDGLMDAEAYKNYLDGLDH